MNDSFCPLPWMQVSIKPSGVMTTCCVMRGLTKDSESPNKDLQQQMQNGKIPYSRLWWEHNSNSYICGKDSIFDVLNSKMLKDVRMSMLKGERHLACTTCWNRERYSNGKISVRVKVKESWKHLMNEDLARKITLADGTLKKLKIRNLELRFGNHCNLKCVMCHPGHSNAWYDDWRELSKRNSFWTDDGSDNDSFLFGGFYYSLDDDSAFKWYKKDKFKEDFLKIYKDLKEIYWAGGEPLLCNEHHGILKTIVDSGNAKDVQLRYDSNLTYLPEKIVSLWKYFKWVSVQASVDDIGIRNEYIRYPSKWEVIKHNLKRLDSIDSFIAHTGVTISCYNILTFLDYAKWSKENMSYHFWKTMHFKHVEAPFHLKPSILPKNVKLKAIEKIEEYLNSDLSPHKDISHYIKVDMFKNYLIEELDNFNEEFYKGFIQHTKNLDDLRPLKFRECFPELYDMIKEDYEGYC